jgi:hypothetical protein
MKVEGYSHSIIQEEFINGTLDKFISDRKEQVDEYLQKDVLSACSLFVLLRQSLLRLTGQDIIKNKTIAGLAWNTFLSKCICPPAAGNHEIDLIFRKSLYGGRVQNFKEPGFHRVGKYRMIDVKSLYPTVMLGKNRHLLKMEPLYGCFPNCQEEFTNKYYSRKLGVYRCKVAQSKECQI